MWWLSMLGLAWADGFDAHALGEVLQGEGWVCSEGRGMCTQGVRVLSLPGVWTATVDAEQRVETLTYSAFWVGLEFPGELPAHGVRVVDPSEAAQAALDRVVLHHTRLGWAVSTRAGLDSTAVSLERGGERRVVVTTSEELPREVGAGQALAALHVQVMPR